MTEERDARQSEKNESSVRVRRRGMIAGAAALIAGLLAKQAVDPETVAADFGIWTQPYFGSFNTPGNLFSVQNTGSGNAIVGETNGTYGVIGKSNASGGIGLAGTAVNGYGLIGTSTNSTGLLGQSNFGPGVFGYSTNNHAVVGQTTQAFYGAVYGSASTNNTVGVYGSTKFPGTLTNNPNAYAGYMDGNFAVVNGFKSAAVPHHDGSYRLVYCMESPENWFEDFGKGALAGGKADVTIDADFTAIVHNDDYRVFITPEGECKGLYVTNKTATGFSVRELQGGASNVAFSYRVVGRRKDIDAKRLAKFDLPKQKLTALPQVPKLPDLPKKP